MTRGRLSRPVREKPLPDRSDALAARAAAIALLARRDFASGELRQKLRAQAFDDSAVAGVIAELKREGVLNDERYAQNYVAYHAGRGHGPIRIAAELRRQGLDAAVVEGALAAGPDWRALAAKTRSTRFGRQPPAGWAEKARQTRFLQYRGFSSDHIRAATGADPDTGLTDL
jgi:regulatory protein